MPRIFLIAAVVLAVFAIIAGAAATGTLFSTTWFVWLAASWLAWLADQVFAGWGTPYVFGTRRGPVQ